MIKALAAVAIVGAMLGTMPEARAEGGSAAAGSASGADPGSAAGSGTPGAAGSAAGVGPGSASGAGSGSGTNGAASGSASGSATAAGSGSGSAAGSGSGTGSGSAAGTGTGSGTGSGSGKRIIIQIPDDVTPPEVSASASPSIARLGKSITLFITAKRPAGVEVNLAEPVELGGAFEVRRKISVEDKITPDGMKLREWQIEITPWELGELEIPQLGVTFVANGKAGQVATNPVPVKVIGVLGDVDDPKMLRGLEPPKTIQSRDDRLLWAGAIGVVALVVGFALYRLYRNRRRHTYDLTAGSGIIPRRLDMASERALEQLLAIEKGGDLDRDDDRRRGYVAMFEVIREYLGARYRVASLDLTTHELLKRLDKIVQIGELSLIESWLERCDLVRYGGVRPAHVEARTALVDARTVILTTTEVATQAAA